MAAFNRFDIFSEHLARGVHQLDTDQLNVYLTNTAPNAATHAIKADLAEIAAGNGYSANGADTQNGISRTGLVTSVTGTDVVITAAGGSIGPFRYAVLFNLVTRLTIVNPLIGWWDYGSAITLLDGEPLTVDFSTSQLTIG